ncbi:secretion protein [Morganella sp. GD04133]|uniref:secretion protein n=1 Tax=Morganella sp. GD04133 TaxID=2975435 RepID=UPI00244C6C82|nr:secretion protein [Morganella sp. GD04133]MDH0354235.1 secretion protein [Morganella sp. GD04133]
MSGNLSVNHRINFNTPGFTTPDITLGTGDNNTVADNPDSNNPFAYALSVLDNLQSVLQKIANALFARINTSADRARNTQDMANRMDEVIADAAKGDDKTRKPVPDDVIRYMHDNGILVDGMTIDDYISKHRDTDGLDKGSLQAIKAALDNSANRDTDLMTREQLKIQKISQEINAVITQTAGANNKLGDLLSMIAQKMY